MERTLASLALAALLLVFVRPASAVIITVDPDNYATGTNLTHATPGVTISHLSFERFGSTWVARRGDVYAAPCPSDDATMRCVDTAGEMAFGASPDTPIRLQEFGEIPSCLRGFGGDCEFVSAIEVVFDSPTKFVQAALGVWHDHLHPAFYALDSTGQQVGSCGFYSVATGCTRFTYANDCLPYGVGPECVDNSVLSLELAHTDISSIIVAGTGDWATLNQLSFRFDPPGSGVPAPGPLGLFCVGMIGLAFRHRRMAAQD